MVGKGTARFEMAGMAGTVGGQGGVHVASQPPGCRLPIPAAASARRGAARHADSNLQPQAASCS